VNTRNNLLTLHTDGRSHKGTQQQLPSPRIDRHVRTARLVLTVNQQAHELVVLAFGKSPTATLARHDQRRVAILNARQDAIVNERHGEFL
jgi:hypothetical protein